MLIRALIVLLVFLNLGVAGWWLKHAEAAPVVPEQPRDVALLELARVNPAPPSGATPPVSAPSVATPPAKTKPSLAPTPSAQPAALPDTVAATSSSTPPAPEVAARTQCVALGPFVDQSAARAAQARLSPAPRRAGVRAETLPARAYAVLLPPLADRAAAQAMTERITAAGFSDLMLINSGPSANGVALGRYGSREAAQRRQAELRAGGFEAQLEPVGQDTQWWLDVTLGEGEGALARRQAQAARAVSRDCG
ncbi:SPOR domain-containing protein [Pseudoxanthomonas sp.]|uniref:SPOR domain-containing protein n=1 Tax=Pseudoxanthomonas sp. TaxID=1871049 RepID=UPI00261DBE3B|nr:SPOR domain-containing protein [Pseudoxanthomonas sp.]WDS35565.1 MAG: SPOR domain-containing protein [Pseudoxanthomonas sp.]